MRIIRKWQYLALRWREEIRRRREEIFYDLKHYKSYVLYATKANLKGEPFFPLYVFIGLIHGIMC